MSACLGRGKKGIIITLGDEQLNPYLPHRPLVDATGDDLQGDVETKDLYREASEKFDIYHIDVDHRGWRDSDITPSWMKYLDEDHYKSVKLNAVTDTIVEMILNAIYPTSSSISLLMMQRLTKTESLLTKK